MDSKLRDEIINELFSLKANAEVIRIDCDRLNKKLGAIDYVVKPTSYSDYVEVAADMKRKAGL